MPFFNRSSKDPQFVKVFSLCNVKQQHGRTAIYTAHLICRVAERTTELLQGDGSKS
jgi:hypothetical protein